eukprot:GAHX01001388.1.p1 GENE.GAHX01001388.1~~GAHX01001388.1.p1  ORF type:complete len:697 (+),score=157.94 GAHX01001388.1:24-2114(+)
MFNNQNAFNSSNTFKTPTQTTPFGNFGTQTSQFGSANTFGQPTQRTQSSLFGSMATSQPSQPSLFPTPTPSPTQTSFGFNQPSSQQQPTNIGTSNIDYRIKVDGKNNLQSINCKLDLKDKTLTELQYEDRFKKPCGVTQPAALPAPSSSPSSFGSSLFSPSQQTQTGFNTGFNTSSSSSIFNKPSTMSSPISSTTSGFGGSSGMFNKQAPSTTGMFGSTSSTPSFGNTMGTTPSFGMGGNTSSNSIFNKPAATNTNANLFGTNNTGLNTSLNTTVGPGSMSTGYNFGRGMSSQNTSNVNTMGNTSSLFNKPSSSIFNTTPSSTLNTGTNNTTSLFGTSTPTSNIGGLNTSMNTSTNSLFNKPSTNTMFGTTQTPSMGTNTNSLFGNTTANQPSTNTSLFGGTNIGFNMGSGPSTTNTGMLGSTNLFSTNTNTNINNQNTTGNTVNRLTQQQLIDLTNPYLVNLELSKQAMAQNTDYNKSINESLIKAYESSNLSLEANNNKVHTINDSNNINKNVRMIKTEKSNNGFTMVKEHIENSRKFLQKINHETTIKTFKVPTKKLETIPKIDEILDKHNVDGFKVKNIEFGAIEWLRRIDIDSVKFDSVFVFKNGSLEVNPNKAFGFNKVNTKAQITFYNVWPKNEYGEREKTDSIIKLSKYENALRKYIGGIEGSEFTKYNYKNGEMSFVVRNFDYFVNK